MSRPAWMPTGNDVMRQAVIAAILAGIAWAVRRELQRRRPN